MAEKYQIIVILQYVMCPKGGLLMKTLATQSPNPCTPGFIYSLFAILYVFDPMYFHSEPIHEVMTTSQLRPNNDTSLRHDFVKKDMNLKFIAKITS